MGNVLVLLKIYPKDFEQMDEIKKRILHITDVKKFEEIEVGFGVKLLRASLIVDDKKGSGDIEEKIKAVDGVSEVEVESVTLIS